MDVPPVPVETVRKQENNQSENGEVLPQGFRLPKNVVEVFGIWKIFVEREKDQTNEAYVVLSAESISDGYKNVQWQNVEYRGFYTTFEEAKNEISGYL